MRESSFWVFSFAPTPPARIYLLVAVPTSTTISNDDLDRLRSAVSAFTPRRCGEWIAREIHRGEGARPRRRGVRAVDDDVRAGARVVPIRDRRLVPAGDRLEKLAVDLAPARSCQRAR